MDTRKLLMLLPTLMLLLTLGFSGCSDDDTTTGPEHQGHIRMYLIDATAHYDAVNIVVNEVQVHQAGSDDDAGWIVINNVPETHDLLTLTNGAQAVLGDETLDAGHYTQIRLILGEGSNIVVDGETYPLTIPSGMQTGLKLNHQFEIAEDVRYDLIVDFDAARSIHQTGNGEYKLNPVVRVIPVEASGAIAGNIDPPASDAMISTVLAGGEIVSTAADENYGYFMLNALPAGTYDVIIEPTVDGWQDLTITGVVVEAQRPTDLGIIELLPE